MKTTTLTMLSALGCVALASNAEAKPKKPNIIMVMVDDMGYADFGCFGSTLNKTPNIDYLAANGVKLTDFHTNGAVSSPTRAALMTGRYQQFYGVEDVIAAAGARDKGLDVEAPTVAKLLKSNGYSTVIYGKWHLGYQKQFNPIHCGFDEFKGYVAGNVDYFSHIDLAGYLDWWHNDEIKNDEGYTTYLLTDYAVDYIGRDHKNPFFLYLPFEVAHTPLQGPNDVAYRIEGKKMGNPPATSAPKQQIYTEMTEALDFCMGRIMDKLRETGLEENTLVLFFSDNGGSGAAWNYPLSGYKGSMLEGGHRVSFVGYWPGVIEKGITSDETILTMDILPTLCDVTGAKLKGTFDGVSFWPTIMKGKKMPERTVFWRMNEKGAARSGDWKALIDVKTREVSLYNLKDDIGEKNELSAQYPEIASQILAEFTAWEASHAHIEPLNGRKVN